MKSLFLMLAVLYGGQFSTRMGASPFIDPTGSYILRGRLEKNRIIGHSGEIRVKLLESGKIAICFYINKGYPGYESGAFMDTLQYWENQALYRPSSDSGCIILFHFNPNYAETQQLLSDPRSGCGFGDGVMLSAFFEKYTSDKPIIQDLSAHGQVSE